MFSRYCAINQGNIRKVKKKTKFYNNKYKLKNNHTLLVTQITRLDKKKLNVNTINKKLNVLLVFAVIYATAAVKNELTTRTVLIDTASGAVILVIS